MIATKLAAHTDINQGIIFSLLSFTSARNKNGFSLNLPLLRTCTVAYWYSYDEQLKTLN